MANGDPFLVGVTQPPNNQATSATLLVHNGSAFGTQHTAFWVQRLGTPLCNAAIRGDNFSTGSTASPIPTGVLGLTQRDGAGIGVLGSAIGNPTKWHGQIGVMGIANSFGVSGTALFGQGMDEQGNLMAAAGVLGQCDEGIGVHGTATSGQGVLGQSVQSAGVTGSSVTGVGVEARSEQSDALQATAQSGVGVLADSIANNGVFGRSQNANGVFGTSQNAIGVEGITEKGLAGVRGRSDLSYGVVGESKQTAGVLGVSQANAIQGWSTGSSGASIGVAGLCEAGAGVQGDSITGIGVSGRSPQGWAGYFQGNVVVNGAFYVNGGPKSAAVKHPDGTHRSLFCLESTESYFEDFGEVELSGASVVVKLDKDFAALVKRNKYQVFLTSYGPEALYVRKRSAQEFEIARVDRGTGGKPRKVRVGYRIVARRADLKSARLPKIKMPAQLAKVTKPDLVINKAKRKQTNALATLAKLKPLPAVPKVPLPDLKAMAEAKPVEANEKNSDRPNAS